MGSAYPTIAADVLARYQRLAGRKVRYITGTDEHGEKIALAAAAQDMSPQQHCDSIVQQYKSLWTDLDISYDSFIRTTAPQHEALVAEVLQRVWDKGDIYKAAYSGWYCVDCEEYKDEKELLMVDESAGGGSHQCPTHRKPCQHRSEENYFFALSKYQEQLQELIEHTDFVQVSCAVLGVLVA
jgi:methionyl-tRNA synthetase